MPFLQAYSISFFGAAQFLSERALEGGKFNDRHPHWYTRRVKEATHIRLHPNNINRDNGIDIPEAWMLTVK